MQFGSGAILIFDDGAMRPGVSSHVPRAIEVDPATGVVAWDDRDPNPPSFVSPCMGGAQRPANGRTVITGSAAGRPFEATPAAWEFGIPEVAPYPEPGMDKLIGGHHNSVFRAYRYAREEVPWL